MTTFRRITADRVGIAGPGINDKYPHCIVRSAKGSKSFKGARGRKTYVSLDHAEIRPTRGMLEAAHRLGY